MNVVVQTWGNSASIRLPAAIMRAAHLSLDQQVDVREVSLRTNPPSAALSDQVKSQDWRARRAERKGRATTAELGEVRAKLRALIGC